MYEWTRLKINPQANVFLHDTIPDNAWNWGTSAINAR